MASIAPLLQTGVALVAGTTTLAIPITDFKAPGLSVVDVDATSTANVKSVMLPGVVKTFSQCTISGQMDANDDWDLHVGISQTFTITWGKKVSGSASGATMAWTGYVQSMEPQSAAVDGLLMMDINITVSGDVTFADEA